MTATKAEMTPRLQRHLPAAGRAVGLRGTAICGRVADYYTGDHAHIVRLAVAAVLEAGRLRREALAAPDLYHTQPEGAGVEARARLRAADEPTRHYCRQCLARLVVRQ